MPKILKDLFRSEKKLGKIFAIFTMVTLVVTLIAPGAFAAFWRTATGSTDPYSSGDQPAVFKYGWGYGNDAWGYGWGYGYGVDNAAGYSLENPDVTLNPGDTIGPGEATVVGTPTAATSVTMTQTVEFSPGGGISVVLPQGLQITQSGGGAFDATAIAAGTGTPPDLGASFSVGGAVDFGVNTGGVKLLFSDPVKVVIPVSAPNGTTVNIGVRHAGDVSFSTASLSNDPNTTCAGGNATPTASTAVVAGGTITIYTCAASSFISYSGTTPPPSGGDAPTGGGGGGGGSVCPVNTSNTATCIASSTISDIIDKIKTYTRSLQIASSLMVYNESAGTYSVQLTSSNGELTLKPNSKSTIWVTIPSSSTVTGTSDWDGKIYPPILKTTSVVRTSGEDIIGTDIEFMKEDIDAVLKVGSYQSPLTFNRDVDFTVPVDLADGTDVQILYSDDGDVWTVGNKVSVSGGYAEFSGKHFSYYALSSSLADAGLSPIEGFVGETVSAFQDIAGHWAKAYIEQIADLGIVSGKTATTFAPNDYITRAELTKIALLAFGYNMASDLAGMDFVDVATSSWYAPYVAAAKKAGIIQGYEGNVFSPNGNINRAEALKILIESAGYTDVDDVFYTNYQNKGDDWWYVAFEDVLIRDHWFAKYVSYAYVNGIVNGYNDGLFHPEYNITRAEVAKIVAMMLD